MLFSACPSHAFEVEGFVLTMPDCALEAAADIFCLF